MHTKDINKQHVIFIVAWLAIFIFCSILSGVASSAETADEKDAPKATAPEVTTPSVSDQPTTPNPPVETEPNENEPPQPELPYDANNAQYMIYLDAGHGWYDNGCTILDRTDIYEKDVTLAITKKIQAALEEMGYTVRMSRENDETCVEELDKGVYKSARRITYANNLGADYYISIHVDSFASDPTVNGTRIYYVDRHAESGLLSDQIALSLVDQLHMDKPLLKNDRTYNVLVMSAMPSVLIEVGFGTNVDDAANMVDSNWQTLFARSVALGINAQVHADEG